MVECTLYSLLTSQYVAILIQSIVHSPASHAGDAVLHGGQGSLGGGDALQMPKLLEACVEARAVDPPDLPEGVAIALEGDCT